MHISHNHFLPGFAMFKSDYKTDIVLDHDPIVHVLVLAKGRTGQGQLVELYQVFILEFELVSFEKGCTAINKGSVPFAHGPGPRFWIKDTIIVASHPELRLEELVELASLDFLQTRIDNVS